MNPLHLLWMDGLVYSRWLFRWLCCGHRSIVFSSVRPSPAEDHRMIKARGSDDAKGKRRTKRRIHALFTIGSGFVMSTVA